MTTILGLKLVDLIMIALYFSAVMAIGFWASRKVKTEDDFFLGGRKFGKALLTMHWLCTGTHSEMAVQVAGATARVGLGGIWYQWMWLFSTPFYWLIAPITRRLRVTTTGDFFRIRYGKGLEMLYALVALFYFALSIALLLRGAGAAISGATGGALATRASVVVLSILFSTYVLAGGLVAAAYTDFLQGILIIALSLLLVPAGLGAVGGLTGLHEKLSPALFAITAPQGANEGDPWFVVTMSILGLVGVVAQPHVMTATGSGKTETEARVGMVCGNFIKRLLTIAWAFTGLIAVAAFPEKLVGLDPNAPQTRAVSETLFGQAIQQFLGDGWRGLMVACLIAGVTSAETFMVGGSALFTRNFYAHAVPNRSHHHYLWVGRAAALGLLVLGILLAFWAESVTQLVVGSVKVIGLLGAAFWLGVVWRRATAAGVWASFAGGLCAWAVMSAPGPGAGTEANAFGGLAQLVATAGGAFSLRGLSESQQILIMLGAQFGLLVFVSFCTRPSELSVIGPFYARLHTPVGKEDEVRWEGNPHQLPEAATLGMDGVFLDYRRSSRWAYGGLQRVGLEIPRLSWFDWVGFAGAWAGVGGLIGLLTWLAGVGSK
jgi:Na+/proline symporter